MEGDAGRGGKAKKKHPAPDAGADPSPIAEAVFQLSTRTAIVLGSAYAVFVVYIAIYTESWLQKLRLLPLLVVAITVPLLGAVLIRKKHHMELHKWSSESFG